MKFPIEIKLLDAKHKNNKELISNIYIDLIKSKKINAFKFNKKEYKNLLKYGITGDYIIKSCIIPNNNITKLISILLICSPLILDTIIKYET